MTPRTVTKGGSHPRLRQADAQSSNGTTRQRYSVKQLVIETQNLRIRLIHEPTIQKNLPPAAGFFRCVKLSSSAPSFCL
jgi:hypothetical protein